VISTHTRFRARHTRAGRVAGALFLPVLAAVDDIGALSVTAAFHSRHLDFLAPGLWSVGFGGICLLQRAGMWRVPPYLELGVFTPRARHGDTAYSGAYLCAFRISEGPCPVLP
jgi:hypothetical protein